MIYEIITVNNGFILRPSNNFEDARGRQTLQETFVFNNSKDLGAYISEAFKTGESK